MKTLVYRGSDGLWHAENESRQRLPGSPCATEAEARHVASSACACEAAVAESKRLSRQTLGHDWDPSE